MLLGLVGVRELLLWKWPLTLDMLVVTDQHLARMGKSAAKRPGVS